MESLAVGIYVVACPNCIDCIQNFDTGKENLKLTLTCCQQESMPFGVDARFLIGKSSASPLILGLRTRERRTEWEAASGTGVLQVPLVDKLA